MGKIIVIGSGIGGLATAIRLRAKGHQVQVFEANNRVGGKLAELQLGGFRFDMGPSLFTLPQEVDNLFELGGEESTQYFSYTKLDLLCRYFFGDGTNINAYEDPVKFADEVEAKTGESAHRILRFFRKSEELYGITSHVFLERSLHKLSTYLRKDTLKSILQLHKLNAFRTMHQANESYFSDERVVQLFDRYATYNGSDPYQAPATLNVISHLEHNLGAYFPQGGMYNIVKALENLAKAIGVQFHVKAPVDRIVIENKSAIGIKTGGEEIRANKVVSNMDIVPTYRKLLPDQPAPEKILNQPRSSSALIFFWGMNRTFPSLDLHNIFFSENYGEEFDHIWKQKDIGEDPTVYLYISSKMNPQDAVEGGENWFCMINVPPDIGQDWDALCAQARERILQKLSKRLGVDVASHIVEEHRLEPRTIEQRTSSFQGALYGNSSNNPLAAFMRHPNFSQKIKNLYFVGGSVHPGGGIPLCLLSAKIVGDLIG
ncbi:MAG: 1-hydroxycarotenoid 3,4-desaturase CrtD [Bacteroidota bacterium]